MNDSGFQFTNRQLLAAVALVGVALALCTVEPRAGLFAAAVLAGAGLVVFGALRQQRSPICAGLFLAAIGLGLFAYHGATVAVWVGRASLPVHVLVIDTDTFEPVSGAKIEVLDGPLSPIEGTASTNWLSQFKPATMQPGVGSLVTDARGVCDFEHEFFAAGRDGLGRNSGYIRTRDFWLRASAPGHGSVLIPMDGQSVHLRDILDRSSLCVTVPLRKQCEH